MSLETGIFTLLTQDATVGPLVGNSRVYPVLMAPNSAYPAIVYRVGEIETLYTLAGEAGLSQKRIYVSCHGQAYLDARSLADAVTELLSGYHGTLADGTVIQGAFQDSEEDLYDDPVRTYRTDLDFEVWVQG
jgi:hypothetical protein